MNETNEEQEIKNNLVGLRFPEGSYTITSENDHAVRVSTGASGESNGIAHPIFSSIASLDGMGISISDLCEMCNARIEDGPMLGELQVVLDQDFEIGKSYTINGEVIDFSEKKSNKFGLMDILVFMVSITDPDKQPVSRIKYTWLLPKRGSK